jgi:hypothetical protein
LRARVEAIFSSGENDLQCNIITSKENEKEWDSSSSNP